MDMNLLALLGIVAMLIAILLGMNIGMTMAVVGIVGYGIALKWSSALALSTSMTMSQASMYSYSVIPLFIMMGNFAFASGLSEGLFDVSNKWLGRLPGGLACATVAACAGFGAICGSVVATAATLGTIAVPQMRKYGYAPSLACGSVAMGGTLGIIIPPSTIFIIYAALTENSAGQLFAAGILPGILLTVLCMVTIMIQVAIKPSLAPKAEKFTLMEKIRSLKEVVGVVLLFVACIGGMFAGIFTANEAAAVGAFLSVLAMAVKKRLTWKTFFHAMRDSVKTSAMCFLNLIGAGIFSAFMTITQMPANLARWIGDMGLNPYAVLAVMLVIYAVMGMLMDAMPMITLTVPIFLPIVLAMGFDPIWFGVLIVLVSELGYITPPVGLCCYILSNMNRDVPLTQVFKGALPFCIPILVTCWIVILFPKVALILPQILYR